MLYYQNILVPATYKSKLFSCQVHIMSTQHNTTLIATYIVVSDAYIIAVKNVMVQYGYVRMNCRVPNFFDIGRFVPCTLVFIHIYILRFTVLSFYITKNTAKVFSL